MAYSYNKTLYFIQVKVKVRYFHKFRLKRKYGVSEISEKVKASSLKFAYIRKSSKYAAALKVNK